MVRVVFFLHVRPSLCTFVLCIRLRVVIYDKLDLWEIAREFLSNVHLESQLSCSISSTHSRLYGTLSVARFCRIEHHDSALSWSRCAGWRVHPVLVCYTFFWIRFQPRTVRKCSRQFLDSNKEDSENIVIRIVDDWVVDVILLLDEDDFRSFWRALELGNVLLLSQLHVTILVNWSQCRALPPWWTVVHLRVSPFFFHLLVQFLQLWMDSCPPTSLTVLDNWGFRFWLDSLGVFAAWSDFWIQFFHPVVFEGNRWWRSRWHENFLENCFSRFHHNNFRDTISWDCIVKDDCITSCLI